MREEEMRRREGGRKRKQEGERGEEQETGMRARQRRPFLNSCPCFYTGSRHQTTHYECCKQKSFQMW